MAKKSKIAKNDQRRALVERYAARRAELREVLKSVSASPEEKEAARAKLMKLPRDVNPNRIRNRCLLTGRPRAIYRKFGISRVMFRELSLMGEIPGVRKASW